MELNIYFKNVGQGDTLMLDWTDGNGHVKNAMIDCNLVDGDIIPVIDHINKKEIKEFEFVVMTHPHSDHFSGFMKFIDYCENENIRIKFFLHTGSYEPNFMSVVLDKKIFKGKHIRRLATRSVNRKRHKKLLWKLYKRLRKLNADRNGIIEKVRILEGRSINLTEDIKLRPLAPESYEELEKYLTSTYSATSSEKVTITQKLENNPYANYLSTFFQLYSETKSWQVLLCSDCTTHTLEKIMADDNFKGLKNLKLLAAQIPHHGSDKNHCKDFWSGLKGIEDAHIVLSVGDGYNHPDWSVIKFFDTIAHKVHSTNMVGGYRRMYSKGSRKSGSPKAEKYVALMNLPGPGSPRSGFAKITHTHDIKCGEKCIRITIDETGNPYPDVLDC